MSLSILAIVKERKKEVKEGKRRKRKGRERERKEGEGWWSRA